MKRLLVSGATMLALAAAGLPSGSGREAKSFAFKGMYLEGCSCNGPCPCELTGAQMGCQGVGAFQADNATYDGVDLSGVRMAYALGAGQWVVIYIDGPESKMQAAGDFVRGALTGFGPVEAVKAAKISISGKDGTYTATVNGGDIMTISTTPVFNMMKKPLTYSNINDLVHPTIMQGKTVQCHYADGSHNFDLKDSNAYYNSHLDSKGHF